MIEDVCPHVCNSLGWAEGLGGGRERIKKQEGIPNGFSIFSSAINSTRRAPSSPLSFDVFFFVYIGLQVHFFLHMWKKIQKVLSHEKQIAATDTIK